MPPEIHNVRTVFVHLGKQGLEALVLFTEGTPAQVRFIKVPLDGVAEIFNALTLLGEQLAERNLIARDSSAEGHTGETTEETRDNRPLPEGGDEGPANGPCATGEPEGV